MNMKQLVVALLFVAGELSFAQTTIQSINGLRQELDARIVTSTGLIAGRVVLTDTNGQFTSVAGTPGNCVQVDGTAIPCGGANWVDAETPSGAIDGANVKFSVTSIPSPPSSLSLYRNGILQKLSGDYTLTGSTIQFINSVVPGVGDILLANYRVASSGSRAISRDINSSTSTIRAKFPDITNDLVQRALGQLHPSIGEEGVLDKGVVQDAVPSPPSLTGPQSKLAQSVRSAPIDIRRMESPTSPPTTQYVPPPPPEPVSTRPENSEPINRKYAPEELSTAVVNLDSLQLLGRLLGGSESVPTLKSYNLTGVNNPRPGDQTGGSKSAAGTSDLCSSRGLESLRNLQKRIKCNER